MLRAIWLTAACGMNAMLNSRLLREQDAQLHFEVMAYFVRQFGAPPRPPVPSPLHKTPGLESLAWTSSDTRSVFHWAHDYYGEIKSACHMSDLEAKLFPEGNDANAERTLTTHRLDTLASGRIPYRSRATLSIIYDPWKCTNPGYFAATVALQIAQFRLATFKPETTMSSLAKQKILLAAAAYNRQGFMLANLPEHVSDCLSRTEGKRAMSQTLIHNTLCFSTCLALRVRRQSAEQITATYGTRMTKHFRKKIPQACRQIDSYTETLEVLQMLAEPKTRRRSGLPNVQRPA